MASRSSNRASTSNTGQASAAAVAPVIDDEERGSDAAVTLRQSVRLPPGPVLYTRRYAMLAMFAALGFLQCAVWNTWGPIASTAQQAYPAFTPSNIATLAIWGPVTCLSGTLFCTMLIQKRGLRQTMIISTLMMAAGTSLRCLSQDPEVFIIMAHFGAILNGFAGVVVGIAPALVSSLWFPVSFRTTATSIGCTFNQLGNAGGFFLGPYMVQSLHRVAKQQQEAAELQNEVQSSVKTSTLNASLGDGLFHSLSNVSSSHLTRASTNKATLANFTLEQTSTTAWNLPYGERLHSLVLDGSILLNESVSPEEQKLLQHYISNYMFVVAGICIALLILVVAYFEDEPPSPPTLPVLEILSSSGRSGLHSQSWRGRSVASRTDVARTRPLTETLRLTVIPLRNGSFLVMLLAYSITLGINVAWSSMLEINLSPLGVSQETASWIGVYVTFGGVMLALLTARLSDLLFGHLKITILCLMLAATVAFVWFLLLVVGHIPFSSWQVQVSAALAGSLNYAVSPLFFELGMELGYPAPEDVLGSIMNFAWNTAGLLCLFSMQQQNSDINSVKVMDYMLVGQGVLVVLLLLFVKEEYRRSGPQKTEEIRSTMRRGRVEEDEESGYVVSDDSDEDLQEAPRVRLLADSSSEDGGRDNPALSVQS